MSFDWGHRIQVCFFFLFIPGCFSLYRIYIGFLEGSVICVGGRFNVSLFLSSSSFCLWEICFLLWLSLIFIFDRSLLSCGANSGWRCRLCAFSPRLWRTPTALCEIDLWKREISKDPGVRFVFFFSYYVSLCLVFIFSVVPCVYATLFSKAWMYLSPIHEYKNSPLMRLCHVFLESF